LLSRRFVAVGGGRRGLVGRVVMTARILLVVDVGGEDHGSTLVDGTGSVMEEAGDVETVSVLEG